MKPLFSIITINYNNALGLRDTINSVYNQTNKDFEYIIIDGGSVDGSTEIIEEFKIMNLSTENEEKFKFQSVSETDSGIYNAMNKGLSRATGEYCFFLNSGDYFASSEVLDKIAESNPTEEIIYGNLIICLNGKVTEKAIGKKKLSFMDLYLSALKHQSTFIRRDLFNRVGFYNESLKIVADFEFFLKTVGIEKATYRYLNVDIAYFDNDGISNNSHRLRIKERNQVLEQIVPSMMLADYRKFENYYFLIPAFKFRATTLALRVIGKCAKFYSKLVSNDS